MKKVLLIAFLLCLGAIAKAEEWKLYEKIQINDLIFVEDDFLIARGNNIFKIDRETQNPEVFKYSDKGDFLCLDSARNLWYGNEKLHRFNPYLEVWDSFDLSNFDDGLKVLSGGADPFGNLWFESEDGYLVFDGEDFDYVRFDSVISIEIIDEEGAIWSFGNIEVTVDEIESNSGYLLRYKDGIVESFPTPQDPDIYGIDRIFPGKEGSVAFFYSIRLGNMGHGSVGIGVFKNDSFEFAPLNTISFIPGCVYPFYYSYYGTDNSGDIHFGVECSNSLDWKGVFDGENYRDLETNCDGNIPPSFELEDENGNLWFLSGEANTRTFSFDNGETCREITPIITKVPPVFGACDKIVFNNNDECFFNSGGKVFKYDYDRFQMLLPEIEVADIAVDKEDRLIIGGKDKIGKFDGNDFEYKSMPVTKYNIHGVEGTSSVTNLYVGSDGRTWITQNISGSVSEWGGFVRFEGGNGLFLESGEGFEHFLEPGLSKRYEDFRNVLKPAFESDGTVWTCASYVALGTGGEMISANGLAKIRNGTVSFLDTNNSHIRSNSIHEIKIDGRDNLWMTFTKVNRFFESFGSGLAKYDGLNWTYYDSIIIEMASYSIGPIKIDREDRIWIWFGIYNPDTHNTDYMLGILNQNKWKIFDDPELVSTEVPISSAFDSKNNLWAAMRKGLYQFSADGEYKRFHSENAPIPNKAFVAIDKYDNIFIDFLTGLAIFNEDKISSSTESASNPAIGLSTHPNPFDQFQIANYELNEAGYVTLRVIDMLGREVSTLVDDFREAGRHEARFDATGLPSGAYLLELRSGGEVLTEIINIIK